MPADILTVCDALVDAVVAALDYPNQASVERVYLAPMDLMTGDSNRHVWIFPAVFGSTPENRGEDALTYRVGVVVAERCLEPGEPSREWTDERVNFTQEKVFDTLDFDRAPLTFATSRQLLTTSGDMTVFAADRLQQGIYWSDMTLEFREIKLV